MEESLACHFLKRYIPWYIPWLLLKRDKSVRTRLFATEIKIFDQQEPCLMTSSLAALT